MESKEPGEASTPTEPQSSPMRDPGGNMSENQDREITHLAVHISQATATEEPLRVYLGESTEPVEPGSRIKLILDLVKDTRCG
ncbi:MAG: hypothetical protein IMY85_06070 [Chloroflexi bacterium]|nr:hypothetical protein [Chloroflexota bacterium]